MHFLRKRLNGFMQKYAQSRFEMIVSDCTQSLALLAIQSAVAQNLVNEDGELTNIGNTLLDSFFHSHTGNKVASPSSYPDLEIWKIGAVSGLPDAVADFFTGAEGMERLNCIFVFLLADMYAPKLSFIRMYDSVRAIIASHIYEDTREDSILSHVVYDGRKAYVEYANHLLPHLTLYGYSVFRASLPLFAQQTIPDIKTFIKLNGLKR